MEKGPGAPSSGEVGKMVGYSWRGGNEIRSTFFNVPNNERSRGATRTKKLWVGPSVDVELGGRADRGPSVVRSPRFARVGEDAFFQSTLSY